MNMLISWEGSCKQNIKCKKQLQPVETILAKRSTDAIDTHLETGICVTNV